MQRHHLLPLALLSLYGHRRFFEAIGANACGFHDFRRNGMLLPCRENAVLRFRLPLHRGPHPRYSELVSQRVGQIARDWWETKADPLVAREAALLRLSLLQRALRRHLLSPRRKVVLNTRDPLGARHDFSTLDRMAEQLWSATARQM